MQPITSFHGEYRFLSNFYYAPIEVNGYHFPTNEHAYQAAKSTDPGDWMYLASMQVSAGKAKRFGRQIKVRPDWDQIKVEVMKILIQEKFNTHPELRQKLLATSGRELIEGNHWGDTFWGVCHGRGQNHLGKILMEYRDNLLKKIGL